MSAKFTGTELLVANAALEVVKSLLKMIANKIDHAEGSNIEAMEQVLQSLKEAVALEKRIEEAMKEAGDEEINLNDWIGDSDE